MTITEYLASSDYYLDPGLDELGEIKATKGNITVRHDQGEPDWRVIAFDKRGVIVGIASFQNPNHHAFIAYLRALEQA
jgi:hypothetical protein